MRELTILTDTFQSLGGDPEVFQDRHIAHLAASGHQLISLREIPGVTIDAKETGDGITNTILVEKGKHIELPIHVCLGITEKTGIQRIQTQLIVKENASASFVAHCMFPFVESGEHRMEATIEIKESARVRYNEIHYQGTRGGMVVVPKAIVSVGPGAQYFSDFTLVKGRVGQLHIDYVVHVATSAVAELTSKVFGRGHDLIHIKEKMILAGENARGLIKTRVALENDAQGEMTGIMEAHAQGARGHVDCREIIKDRAIGRAIPIVLVTNPLAKVTHEAAIGTVDKKELETLMARGLDPEQATELIVSGMLQ
jgi:Fe-S cluster assembly scaffold protein SufB